MTGDSVLVRPGLRSSRGDAAEGSLSILIGLEGLALGGCPVNAIDLGRTLRERGHRVSVFAIHEDVSMSLLPVAERAGFAVSVLPSDASSLVRARQMRGLIRDSDADIIHVFGPWLGPSATVAAAGVRPRAAIVTNWMMENVNYTPAGTTLIVGTRQLQQDAAAWHPGPVELQEPPVDMAADQPDDVAGRQFRSDWQIGDDEIALVVVSRLHQVMKAESIEIAIRTVGQMGTPIRLVVVGDGNARVKLEEQAAKVNAGLGKPAIIFTGAMSDPRSAYDAADIAFCMGGSALRALAHAKPLIVPGINGFSRTFQPSTVDYFYDNGFFGEAGPADPVGHLRDQLTELVDPVRRRELAQFGASEVARRFSLDVGADQLESIYRRALSACPSAPVRFGRRALLSARLSAHEIKNSLHR